MTTAKVCSSEAIIKNKKFLSLTQALFTNCFVLCYSINKRWKDIQGEFLGISQILHAPAKEGMPCYGTLSYYFQRLLTHSQSRVEKYLKQAGLK